MQITEITRIPYEADEEPGMPTYLVTGTDSNDVKFVAKISLEIDGRDGDCEIVEGGENLRESHEDVFMLSELFSCHPTLEKLHAEAAEAYYNN